MVRAYNLVIGRLRTRRRFYGAVPVPPCYRRDPSCGSLSLPLTIYIIPHQPRFVYWQNNQTSSTFRRTFCANRRRPGPCGRNG
nr:MAG TPA: hypothetical protein [Caudoviricetes sp.]